MSWNETDMITQLPIHEGDKVRLLILGNRQPNVFSETDINYGKIEISGSGTTNIHELWSPILPPIHGTYADYSGIDKIKSGIEKDMLFSFLKKTFIFSDLEEIDRVEDYNKNAKTQTLQVYLRSIERGYGCWSQSLIGTKVLGHAMILEDIYQDIMKYNPIVMHSDWSDKKNPIHLYMPWHESIQIRINNWYNKTFNASEKMENAKTEEEKVSALTELFMISDSDRVFDDHRSLCAVSFSDILTKKIKERTPITDKNVQNIIKAFKEILLLDGFMAVTRKFYTPQTGKGSQDSELEPYQLLNNCVNKIIKKRNDKDKKENVQYYPDANGYYDYMLKHNEEELKKNKNV